MAITLICHGNKAIYHEIDCPYCGARLGYLDTDIKQQYLAHDAIALHFTLEYWIPCPDCYEKISLRIEDEEGIQYDGEDIFRYNTGPRTTLSLIGSDD